MRQSQLEAVKALSRSSHHDNVTQQTRTSACEGQHRASPLRHVTLPELTGVGPECALFGVVRRSPPKEPKIANSHLIPTGSPRPHQRVAGAHALLQTITPTMASGPSSSSAGPEVPATFVLRQDQHTSPTKRTERDATEAGGPAAFDLLSGQYSQTRAAE